jgi:isopentenyldiphosphate isomerase
MIYYKQMTNSTQTDQLDIISEEDIVIDTKERIEIHQKGLLHREIHVWFFDKEENIIFQKRGLKKSSGGLLDATIGGHVDAGENYIDTAIRETEEETGISITESDLIFLNKFRATSHDNVNKTTNNFLRHIYLYRYAILKSDIKKEKSVIGVDFKKFSPDHLLTLKKEELLQFDQYILTDEIPILIKYLKSHSL